MCIFLDDVDSEIVTSTAVVGNQASYSVSMQKVGLLYYRFKSLTHNSTAIQASVLAILRVRTR